MFFFTHNLKDVLEAVTLHYFLREVRGVGLESMYDEMNINEI